MRMFYEEWSASDAKSDSSEESVLADASAKTTVILAGTIRQTCLPTMPMSHMENFLHISFSNHMLILCKDMNKAFVDYVIQDYKKPMGVATYKTSKDMSEELRKALPDIEDLKRLLESEEK